MSFSSSFDSGMNSQHSNKHHVDNNVIVKVMPVSQDSELACHEALSRSAMYNYLSKVYLHPPTAEMLACLMDASFIAEIPDIFSPQAVAELTDCATSLVPDKELPLLKQEFMDLYVVPAGRYVTPFEDVYRGVREDGQQEGGPLLGERAIAAKIMYRSAGALMDHECKELPNHIGVELSFMSFLCEREATSLQEQDTTAIPGDIDMTDTTEVYRLYQLLFLQQHLNDWFPQLNLSIQAKAKTPFYRGMAQLTEDFITWDMMALLPPSYQRQ